MSRFSAHSSGGVNHRNTFVLQNNGGMASSRVEILFVKGLNDESFHGAQSEVDLKAHDMSATKLKIRYKVYITAQQIKLWVEYEPSTAHENFYAQYRRENFQPPRVALLINNEQKSPGEYEIEWEGRDQTPDRRLLIAGRYQVKIEGIEGGTTNTDSTAMVVAKPRSHNFGIHYRKSGRLESTKREVDHAALKQQTLSDGTGFNVNKQLAITAAEAVDKMKDSSTVYWSGHSNPFEIVFHRAEGRGYRRQNNSSLSTHGRDTTAPDASIEQQVDDCCKDLFLIMLNGCRTANEVIMVQTILKHFNPGPIDGIHGPRTTAALRKFQDINDISPADGTNNPATLAWFGISPEGMDERTLTRTIQRRLNSYDPGKVDSKMGVKTRTALTNYQTSHPSLVATGEIDEPTKSALKVGDGKVVLASGREVFLPENIAEAFGHKGADITMGFEHKIDFDLAEDWAIKFWDNLVNGDGVNTAANNAKAMVDHRRQQQCEFHIYPEDGVQPESTLHPARYGKNA